MIDEYPNCLGGSVNQPYGLFWPNRSAVSNGYPAYAGTAQQTGQQANLYPETDKLLYREHSCGPISCTSQE